MADPWESMPDAAPAGRAVDTILPSDTPSANPWDAMPDTAAPAPVTAAPAEPSYPGIGPIPGGKFEKFEGPRRTAEQVREWVTEGGAALPGLPVDVYNLFNLGGRKLTSVLPSWMGGDEGEQLAQFQPVHAGSSEWFRQPLRDIGAIGNPYLKPEGGLAKAAVEGATGGAPFGLPGMVAGAGGGFASEALGDFYKGSPYEPAARIGGAVVGGFGGTGVAQGVGKALSREVGPGTAAMQALGITPKLATDVSESGMIGAPVHAVSKTMAGGRTIQKAAEEDIAQLGKVRDELGARYGTAETSENIGSSLRQGVLDSYKKFQQSYSDLKDDFIRRLGDPSRVEVAPDNTIKALQQNAEKWRLNPDVGAETVPPVFKRLLDKLSDGQTKPGTPQFDPTGTVVVPGAPTKVPPALTWEEAESLRTWVGEQAFGKNIVRSDTGPTEGQWKRLYGSLTDDMKANLKPGSPEAQKFQEMNEFYKAGKDKFSTVREIQDLTRNPEQVFSAALAGSTGEKGGGTVLRNLRDILQTGGRSQTWDNLVANRVYSLGANRDGTFSMNKFLTSYTDPKTGISQGAKEVLFEGVTPELENLRKVAQQMKASEKYANPAGTAGAVHTLEFLGSAGTALGGAMHGDLVSGLSLAGTMLAAPAATAKLMTSPAFIKWLATPVPKSLAVDHIGKLAAMSALPGMEQYAPVLDKIAAQATQNLNNGR
jgi:hypothetical protein